MFLTENEQKWSNIISEGLHVTDQNKLAWMSKYAVNHEIKEGLQNGAVAGGIYSTPLNTLGMANPMMPQGVGFQQNTGIGDTGKDFHDPSYVNGSGDIPMSTLTMALEVAAMTIGFELVPVIPSSGPWCMLSYFDTPYAGGKLGKINETVYDGKGAGAENKPIYIKFNLGDAVTMGQTATKLTMNTYVAIETTDANSNKLYLYGQVIGYSRIDNDLIIKVDGVATTCTSGTTTPATIASVNNKSIADVFANVVTDFMAAATSSTAYATPTGYTIVTPNVKCRPELVATAADHVQGFSNFFDGGDDPMTRAENETGVGNTIGARIFTKMVQMGSYEVTGAVTRQQLQDMPLYGIDVIGKVLEYMQNEISQAINNRILDRVFKLGVTNAVIQKKYQDVDLNLYIDSASGAPTTQSLATMCPNKFIGVDNQNHAADFPAVRNAALGGTYENVTTFQRRIMSRMLAAANLIANVSRRGRATWAVTNTQVLSALQDASAFVVAPMTNTLTQDGSQSLYFAGSLAGLNIYVDPYMTWDDNRICVGRKSDGQTPGVVFMPYILCDTVQTVVEGTMAPKLLCNSRFAIVDAGFHPEQNYLTFVVDVKDGMI